MMKKIIIIFTIMSVAGGQFSWAQSVSNSADQTSAANKTAATQAYMFAAGYFVMAGVYASQCPHPASACVQSAVDAAFGVLSIEQGNANNAAAGQAATTSGESSIGTSDPTNPSGTVSYTTGTGTTTSADDAATTAFQAATSAQQALAAAGTTTSATGATAADGTSVGTGSVGSPAAMAGAGLPQSVIDSAMTTTAAIAKDVDAKLAASGLMDGGGGGGGGGGSMAPAEDPGKIVIVKGKPPVAAKKRDPAQMAGLQKNYNGEPIGVSQDDIFLMMNRRYLLKDSQDSFLHENEILLRK